MDGLAWSRSGFLAVADVRQRKIFRLDSDPHPQVLRDNDGGASGLAYDLQGRLYICESETRRVTRFDLKGKIETLAEDYQGKKFNAPNDIVVRKDGHVYFTDPAFGSANDRRELDFYGIWHISPKGDLDAVAKWQTRPNGIAVSADGKVLFVYRFRSARRGGFRSRSRRRGGQISAMSIRNIAGVPGGIRTDVDGRFYVAAKGVARVLARGQVCSARFSKARTRRTARLAKAISNRSSSPRAAVSIRVKLGVKGALQY